MSGEIIDLLVYGFAQHYSDKKWPLVLDLKGLPEGLVEPAPQITFIKDGMEYFFYHSK